MGFSFPKSSRILSTKHFKSLERESEEQSGRFIRVNLKKGKYERKLGITVSRKFGKAHLRNRFKRIVREAFRLSQHNLPPSIQLNIRPKQEALYASMHDIQQELKELAETLIQREKNKNSPSSL